MITRYGVSMTNRIINMVKTCPTCTTDDISRCVEHSWTLDNEDLRAGVVHLRPKEMAKLGDSAVTKLASTETGAKKHSDGKLPVHLIPPEITIALAEALDVGVRKGYGERNWEKGLKIDSVHLASALRHITRYRLGEDTNTESAPDGTEIKIHHLKAALVNIAMAVTQVMRGREDLDDRAIKINRVLNNE